MTENNNANFETAFNDFDRLLEQSFAKQTTLEGTVIKGTVVDIQNDVALINVGLKSEGRVPLKEFGKDASIQIGDQVDVYIDRYEDRQGDILLSHEKARQETMWLKLTQAFKDKTPVDGTIINHVKGGLMVDLCGTTAFLPGSQVDIRPVQDLTHLIGTTKSFLILKIDDVRSNVVVSHRAVLETERAAGRYALLSNLEQGQKLEGVVKNITPYGAFVDLGGIDGLLHVTDISWKRIQHPSEVLTVGQNISVVVTRFNKETQRISLGMKQLEKDPWQKIHETCKVGDRMKGVVTNVTHYGAFVELDEGIEGLIYVAEMAWSRKNVSPEEILSPQQAVEVMILEIDVEKRRISLGLKQCTENPFEKFEKDFAIGSEIEGTIKEVTEFGLLVQLPGEVTGTVHKSDLSWSERGDDLLQQYRPGDRIHVKLLNVNPAKEIIGIGVKQLTPDPFQQEFASLAKGKTVSCKVLHVSDAGLEVSLGQASELRTLIKRSDLGRDKESQNPHQFSVGDLIEAKVVSVNPSLRKVVLSIKAQEIEDQHDAMAGYSQGLDQDSRLGRILETALKNEKTDESK
jgi:small subunit ribosomal protein S1